MKQNFLIRNCLLAAGILTMVTGCHKQSDFESRSGNLSEASVKIKPLGENESFSSRLETSQHTNADLLKSVRAATSRFNSTTQAIHAGYVPDNRCVSVPGLGGMGYHWANPSLVDPVFDLLNPEAVLYETGPGGNLRLVAVEYIVVNTGQARPMFGNHLFDIGGTPLPIPHWSLHVWVHKENPAGVFTRFNPTVSCQ